MNAQAMSTQLRRELAGLAQTGQAGRVRTVIVCQELGDQLRVEGMVNSLGVSGTTGNFWRRYSFDVLVHPTWGGWAPKEGFFLVAHRSDVYAERYLGREPEFLGEAGTTKRRATGQLEELNPIAAYLRRGNDTYSFMPWEDATELLANDPSIDLGRAVLNPPELQWLGNLAQPPQDTLPAIVLRDCDTFFAGYGEPKIGHLFMQELPGPGEGWVLSVKALDGFGQEHTLAVTDPTSNPLEFARVALKYFCPEEVLLAFLWGNTPVAVDLPSLQALYAPPNWVNLWSDPDKWGQITDWDDPHVQAVDTAGITHLFSIPGATRDQYFPADWIGWPDTQLDRVLNTIASTIADDED